MATDDQDRQRAGEKPHTGSINLPLCLLRHFFNTHFLLFSPSSFCTCFSPLLSFFSPSFFTLIVRQSYISLGRITGGENHSSMVGFGFGTNQLLFSFYFLAFLPYWIVDSAEKSDVSPEHYAPAESRGTCINIHQQNEVIILYSFPINIFQFQVLKKVFFVWQHLSWFLQALHWRNTPLMGIVGYSLWSQTHTRGKPGKFRISSASAALTLALTF